MSLRNYIAIDVVLLLIVVSALIAFGAGAHDLMWLVVIWIPISVAWFLIESWWRRKA